MATAPPTYSPSLPSTWPEALDALTQKAKAEGGLRNFKQAMNFADKVEAVKEIPGVM